MSNEWEKKQMRLVNDLLKVQHNFFIEIGNFNGSIKSFANLTLSPTALFVAKVMVLIELMAKDVDPEFNIKALVAELADTILSNLYRLEEKNGTLH